MTVYLFRHGDVVNPGNVLYGRLPGFHLSEQGKQDVQASARKLQDAQVARVVSSPLERTVETSEIIAQTLGLPKSSIAYDDRLIEVDCRDWTGKPMTEFLKKSDYNVDRSTQTATEPILDAGNRILSVLNDHRSTDSSIILVSHGDPIMGLVTLLTNDWNYIQCHYIQKAEYIVLDFKDDAWHIQPRYTSPSVETR